jgi:hypothetical protein
MLKEKCQHVQNGLAFCIDFSTLFMAEKQNKTTTTTKQQQNHTQTQRNTHTHTQHKG